MNIFNKVTLQSLKKNRTRTVVTIIGIMLSAAMICAVTTFVSSMQNYALQNAVYKNGDWHASAADAEFETYKTISDSDEVSDTVYAQQLGYAVAEDCNNEYKPYLYVLGASDGFEKMMSVHLISGKYPTDETEIILPDHLSENGGITYKIGDTLILKLGSRMSGEHSLGQNNPYEYSQEEATASETLVVRETRTYTVVGFYERPGFEEYTAPGYTAITLADKTPYQSSLYSVYFKMKNPKNVYDFMKDNQITGTDNRDVLTYSGAFRFDGFNRMLSGLAAIVIGLIIFGSVSLIYNAFSISVSERTKQFGLLSSVGATKKQLRRMVFFEALAVSAVGIPLGIIVGIGGIGITLLIIGHKFEEIIGYSIPLRICVSPTAVLTAVAVALITVLISAWLPSKRATRVSAVEAIRQNIDITSKGKPVKTSKLMYRMFGLPGMLANKYYKRSRKKYRATVISLFMSIVLFVSASAFTDYLMESVSGAFSTNKYDLVFHSEESDFTDMTKDELLDLVKDDAGVTDAAYALSKSFIAKIDKSYLSNQGLEGLEYINFEQDTDSSVAEISAIVTFVNDSEYKELLEQYKLDEQKYMNPDDPLAIAIDGNTHFNYTEGKYIAMNFLKSDECEVRISAVKAIKGYICLGEIEDEEGNQVLEYMNEENREESIYVPLEEAYEEISLKSGKVIYDCPYYFQIKGVLMLLYPESLKSSVLPGADTSNDYYKYFFISEDHKLSYNALKETLSDNGFKAGYLNDNAELAEASRNVITIIQVFAYGFIILISLIAAANVFNTISTNISLRRREFAMLKSVGMTAKGFNKMMNFECLLYGSKALLYGLPVSVSITYLIYRSVSEGYSTGFRLPWMSICIAVLSVFAVVFVTMMYSMRKIKKDNPIDALKNENL